MAPNLTVRIAGYSRDKRLILRRLHALWPVYSQDSGVAALRSLGDQAESSPLPAVDRPEPLGRLKFTSLGRTWD